MLCLDNVIEVINQTPVLGADYLASYIHLVYYVALVVITATILYTILEWLTMDRAIKIFNNKFVFAFIGKKAYYGVLHTPSRGGGSFEIFFKGKNIENPISLLMFLIENYEETGRKKFLLEANKLLREFKKMKILEESLTLEDVKKKYNPWASPSLVSRKVFKEKLSELDAIICFRYTLTKQELRRRWRELEKLYHFSLLSRIARNIYNILSLVKDKLSQALMKSATPIISSFSPELRATLEDFQKKTSQIQTTYHPLLENSIGRLINVKVVDVDGESKIYQGVLREYSNNYILVYDVDYKIQMKTFFKNLREVEGYPKPYLETHGLEIDVGKHIALERNAGDGQTFLVLRNISDEPIRVEKIKIGGKEFDINKIVFGGEKIEIQTDDDLNQEIEVSYEISREADILWPRSKVEIIGLGDYPAKLLENILRRPF